MTRLVARVDAELVAAIDELIADGPVGTRSEAVRLGLERLVDQVRRPRIGQEIVDGYLARPQDEGEVGWADAATVQMIVEEPW